MGYGDCERAAPHPQRPPGEHSRWWISPGARLWLSTVSCIIALGVIFLLVPFYEDRGQSRQDERTRAAAAVLQRRNGAALLHRFDCTYGQATRFTILEAARSSARAAHLSLQGRHAALARGDRASADRQLKSYRNSRTAATRYGKTAASLQALGRSLNGEPFPPCS